MREWCDGVRVMVKSKSVNCERFKSGHCVANTVWRNHRHDSLTSFRRRSKSDRKSKLLLPLLPAETIIVLEYTWWCQTAFAVTYFTGPNFFLQAFCKPWRLYINQKKLYTKCIQWFDWLFTQIYPNTASNYIILRCFMNN
jgi:hypothetical protein